MSTLTINCEKTDRRSPSYWAVHIPAGQAAALDLADKTSTRRFGFVRAGTDVELRDGAAVLDSEGMRKGGYSVYLRANIGGELLCAGIRDCRAIVARIKAVATPDQWALLCDGTSDVSTALRVLKSLSILTPEQIAAVNYLQEA